MLESAYGDIIRFFVKHVYYKFTFLHDHDL